MRRTKGPMYWQIRLGDWRERVARNATGYMLKFKELVKDLPEDAIVVSNRGRLSILVDDDGNLLAFK